MPAKVRVYELARELDVTNKEVIALCDSLGIDAKSHSSSLVEAQADRVRKKAESEGITGGQSTKSQPSEEESSGEEILFNESDKYKQLSTIDYFSQSYYSNEALAAGNIYKISDRSI